MNDQDFSKAKVGDRVWLYSIGDYAYIQDINNSGLLVYGHWYDLKGHNRAGVQMLFWGPPEIIAPPPPKRMVKKWIAGYWLTDVLEQRVCTTDLLDSSEEAFNQATDDDDELAFGPIEIEIEDRS